METLVHGPGHAPADFLVKGKTLLALWVQKQAAVGAFEDAFVFSALLITVGIRSGLADPESAGFRTREADGHSGIRLHLEKG